jgi:DNA-binding NtrC family response regulator
MFAQFFVVNEPTTEDEVVRAYAKHVLEECGGSMTRAAKILGIDRRSLYRRLEKKVPDAASD